MNIRAIACCCILTSAAFAADSSKANDADLGPVVPLPEYRVQDYSSHLGFAWKAVVEDEKIKAIRFSRVNDNSLARHAGLQLDDKLISIDKHPIANLSVTEFQKLFYRDWKPGDTLTWDFEVERGSVFAKKHAISLKLKTLAPPADGSTPHEPATK